MYGMDSVPLWMVCSGNCPVLEGVYFWKGPVMEWGWGTGLPTSGSAQVCELLVSLIFLMGEFSELPRFEGVYLWNGIHLWDGKEG